MFYKKIETLDEELPLIIATALSMKGTRMHPEKIERVLNESLPTGLVMADVVRINGLYNALTVLNSNLEDEVLSFYEMFATVYAMLFSAVEPHHEVYDEIDGDAGLLTVYSLINQVDINKKLTTGTSDEVLHHLSEILNTIPQCKSVDDSAFLYYLLMVYYRFKYFGEVILTDTLEFSDDAYDSDDAIQLLDILSGWC